MSEQRRLVQRWRMVGGELTFLGVVPAPLLPRRGGIGPQRGPNSVPAEGSVDSSVVREREAAGVGPGWTGSMAAGRGA
jgi:hypothetical protein